ncbi:MAG: hypothetical protein HN817_10965 [Porticoccaceae bacterium]|jgi:hypothetical protein|nr:hypothetical protein [Porticoccaceae bacterium]MBT7376439.1 hypothetical protein [Porticoccaceae bacterium]
MAQHNPRTILNEFFRHDSAGGILLVLMAVLAILFANSPLSSIYQTFLNTPMQVRVADAEDPDFWARINLNQVQLIMLTMPNLQDILQATQQLRATNYAGKLASIVHYEDERDILLEAGVDVVFNHYLNAGAGFAERSIHLLDDSSLPVVD